MRTEYGVRVLCFSAAPLPDIALYGELVPLYARINVEVHAYMHVGLRASSVYFCTILTTVGIATHFHISWNPLSVSQIVEWKQREKVS
jgi:hypothetical protein